MKPDLAKLFFMIIGDKVERVTNGSEPVTSDWLAEIRIQKYKNYWTTGAHAIEIVKEAEPNGEMAVLKLACTPRPAELVRQQSPRLVRQVLRTSGNHSGSPLREHRDSVGSNVI